MDLVRRIIEVKTEHGIFTVPAWSNGRVTASDEKFFELLEHRRTKMFGKIKKRDWVKDRKDATARARMKKKGKQGGYPWRIFDF